MTFLILNPDWVTQYEAFPVLYAKNLYVQEIENDSVDDATRTPLRTHPKIVSNMSLNNKIVWWM